MFVFSVTLSQDDMLSFSLNSSYKHFRLHTEMWDYFLFHDLGKF